MLELLTVSVTLLAVAIAVRRSHMITRCLEDDPEVAQLLGANQELLRSQATTSHRHAREMIDAQQRIADLEAANAALESRIVQAAQLLGGAPPCSDEEE